MDEGWRSKAACRRSWVDTDWFFPRDLTPRRPGGACPQSYNAEDLLRARLICTECPVRQLCWEENRDAEIGVIAGTTEQERRRMLQLAQRREDLRAATAERPAQQVEFTDLPLPVSPPKRVTRPSSKAQGALYAFKRGYTVPEAAAEADLSVREVRRVFATLVA